MRGIAILISLLAAFSPLSAQEFIPLWPGSKMPNSKGIAVKDSIANERQFHVGTPGMYAFFTSKQENKNAAVLIIPGGGYSRLAFNISGFQLAKWFNTLGINAFVLIHRLPHSIDLKEREKGPLQDAQRAMKIIRKNATLWEIDLDKVGVMGSSAGGHLAASLGTINGDFSNINDEFDLLAHRPNFMILVSPVIDMGPKGHNGSRGNLLGINPSKEVVEKFSLQNQVNLNTPPTFLVHAFNDQSVSPMSSLWFYQKLIEYKIPSSLHIFNQGAH
ncbi:alpha/beta hydrolase, partial [Pseudoxanthomonas sp. SGD-10]